MVSAVWHWAAREIFCFRGPTPGYTTPVLSAPRLRPPLSRGQALRLVGRLARPGRQDRGIVMRRHLGVGPIDLRLVEAGFDDGNLGIVRHRQSRHPAQRCEGSGNSSTPLLVNSFTHRNPISKKTCPGKSMRREQHPAMPITETLR